MKVVSPIKAGQFILEHVGEVVTETEYKRRLMTNYAEDKASYCLQLHGHLLLDSHRKGSESK